MEPTADLIDFESVLDSAALVLNRATANLRADAVAVLLATRTETEIAYFWSRLGESKPHPSTLNADPDGFGDLRTRSGAVEARSGLARLLAAWISPHSQSFLLFPRQVRQRAVTVLFCFAGPTPARLPIPEAIAESLDLAGIATWSVKEVIRLRSELRTTENRLAGRKLVERAKGILQLQRGISEEQAYEYLRGQSRRRRMTLTALAEEVVKERGGQPQVQLTAR